MTYSVGIIGTGFGSKVHLPSFQHHDKFNVEIIAGRNPTKTAEIAKDAGIISSTNWRELLEMDLDLITVSTPPFLHYQMAKEVLESGKNLLLEKPTTHDASQAKELVSLSLNKGLIGMMCHEFRWLSHRNYFAHLIKEEKIVGNVQEIHYQKFYAFAASPEQPKFGWLWDNRFEGGMLGAVGSHLIDQVRHTIDREFQSVSGYLTTRTKTRANTNGGYSKVTADDGFGLHFKMENDILGTLTVSTTLSPSPTAKFIVSGDEGTVYLEDDTIYHGEDGGNFEKIEIPNSFKIDETLGDLDRRIPPFLRLLDQVNESLDTGSSLTPSLTDGWKNQQVVDAVRMSHRQGSRINIS